MTIKLLTTGYGDIDPYKIALKLNEVIENLNKTSEERASSGTLDGLVMPEPMKWISTEERQPKTGGVYFILEGGKRYGVRFYDAGKKRWRNPGETTFFADYATTHFAVNVPRA